MFSHNQLLPYWPLLVVVEHRPAAPRRPRRCPKALRSIGDQPPPYRLHVSWSAESLHRMSRATPLISQHRDGPPGDLTGAIATACESPGRRLEFLHHPLAVTGQRNCALYTSSSAYHQTPRDVQGLRHQVDLHTQPLPLCLPLPAIRRIQLSVLTTCNNHRHESHDPCRTAQRTRRA